MDNKGEIKMIQINLKKSHLIYLTLLVALIAGGLLVSSYGGSNPSVMGHSAGEITGVVPTGAIMVFNLTSCPSGWKAADGTSSTPDLRGQFIRGLNNFGTGARSDGNQDPAGARSLGAYQADAFQGHYHKVYRIAGVGSTDSINHEAGDRDPTSWTNYGGALQARTPISDGTHGTPRISSETRPKNVALIYCQKE